MLSFLRKGKHAASVFRAFSAVAPPDRKVAILGAAGGIGQPLSLLMKVERLEYLDANDSRSIHW